MRTPLLLASLAALTLAAAGRAGATAVPPYLGDEPPADADGAAGARALPPPPARWMLGYVFALGVAGVVAEGAPAAGAEVAAAGRPVIAQLRLDAEPPEGHGEYVLLQNRGAGRLELGGHRLEKRRPGRGVVSCVLGRASLAPGGLALVTGGAYDGRYPLPAGTPVLACGAATLLGGLSSERVPQLRLVDPRGAVESTVGAEGGPACPILLRRDLDGPDRPDNWGCVDGD